MAWLKHPWRCGFAVAVGLLGTACETSSSSSGYTPYTAIYVDPADFLGGVACSGTDGSMKSYVATLYDVSDNNPETIVTVTSSPPTSCRAPITFAQIAPGHFYTVTVDGYELPACSLGRYDAGCLVPAGGWGSGVRTMVLSSGAGVPAVSAYVAPTWTTRCGRLASAEGTAGAGGEAGAGGTDAAGADAGGSGGAGQGGSSENNPFYVYDPLGPTEAVYQTSSRFGGCEPLPAPTGPSRVVITAAALRGGLSCGKEPGQVARFEVRGPGDTVPRLVDCGAEVRYEDLPPGTSFEARVFAFESGSSGPRWGSQCAVRTGAGQTRAAVCDKPSERGSLLIPGDSVLCEGASSYRATAVGLGLPAQSAACPADLSFSGLPAGLVDVAVERKDGSGASLGSAICTGYVEPGQQAKATCSF